VKDVHAEQTEREAPTPGELRDEIAEACARGEAPAVSIEVLMFMFEDKTADDDDDDATALYRVVERYCRERALILWAAHGALHFTGAYTGARP
jgi:hypothetical protein